MTSSLYERDFYTWTQTQAKALRAHHWAALDIDHLAEEIESLGRSEQRAIESQLKRLLLHLLKWRYDPAQEPRRGLKWRYDPAQEPRRGWQLTILDARSEIAELATGALQSHPGQYLSAAYRYARKAAAIETGLPLETFPETCPWPIDQVLDEDFLPEAPPGSC